MAEFVVQGKVLAGTASTERPTVTVRAISPEVALKLGTERIKRTFPSARSFTVRYAASEHVQTAADFTDPNRSENDES